MDVQIIGAIIAGIFAVIGAIIGVIGVRGERLERGKRQKAEQATKTSLLFLMKELEYRYGLKASLVVSSMELRDFDGTVELKRTWEELRVAPGGAPVSSIPVRIWVQHKDGKIIQPPNLVKPVNFPKSVDIRHVKTGDKEYDSRIEITGRLTDADPPLAFTFVTVCSKGVCASKEEMDETYKQDEFKKEYHSFDVTMPMDVLELRVKFPDGYLFDAYPMVFYGHTETTYDPEFQRVKDGFGRTANSAYLRVELPLVGFRYVIYWIPPTEQQLAQLKQKR